MKDHNIESFDIEAVDGRLEFLFWAWVWDEIKSIWSHISFGGSGGF